MDEIKSNVHEGAGISVIEKGDESLLLFDVQNRGLDFLSALNKLEQVPDILTAKKHVETALRFAIKGFSLCAMLVLAVGCSTYAELGQDHIGRTLISEQRSPFGTNMGFAKLQHCEKKYTNTDKLFYEPVNCTDLTGWVPMWSQGQGGQIVGGALTGLGFGLGSAFSGAGNAASSISNSTTNVVTKGGHR